MLLKTISRPPPETRCRAHGQQKLAKNNAFNRLVLSEPRLLKEFVENGSQQRTTFDIVARLMEQWHCSTLSHGYKSPMHLLCTTPILYLHKIQSTFLPTEVQGITPQDQQPSSAVSEG